MLILLVSGYEKEAAAGGGVAPLTTLRLTDRENTVYYAEEPSLIADLVGAHVLWTEYITFFDDIDLFYARLPEGTVTRLSDRTATVGKAGGYRAVLDSSEQLYVAWAEDVGGEESGDVFFWKTGMDAPVNISDHSLSNGNAGGVKVVIDSHHQAHVLWAEATISSFFGPSIFYWSEASAITRKLSTGSTTGGFFVTNTLALAIYDDTIHAVWQDFDSTYTGGVQPFYWNSDTETVIPVRGDGAGSSEGYIWDYHLDNSGISHILWAESLSTGTYFFYWNSASLTNEPLPGLPSGLIANSEGNAHVFYEAGSAVYHWNTLNQNAVPIPRLDSREDILAVAGGKSGNHFHLIWETTDPDFPGHMNDLFYWRSDMNEAVNISDQAIAPADPTNVEMEADETDTVHVLWEETAHLYYNSSSELTIQPPAILSGLAMAQVVARDGVAYAQFLDSYAAEPPFYIWQSDTNEATPVTANLQGEMRRDVDSASANTIWLDSDGLLHIVFEDGSTFNHWDKLRGFQDLAAGAEMEPLAHEGIILSATDSVSGSYLVWQGDTVGGDGNDLYAAFVGPDLPFSVYVPLAVR